jgi:hypothetical protein
VDACQVTEKAPQLTYVSHYPLRICRDVMSPFLCIAIFQHFIWQVKQKVLGRAVVFHLMPIVMSSVQGSGNRTVHFAIRAAGGSSTIDGMISTCYGAECPLRVCAPCKGGAFLWVQIPSGNRSSRKQSEQSWR